MGSKICSHMWYQTSDYLTIILVGWLFLKINYMIESLDNENTYVSENTALTTQLQLE